MCVCLCGAHGILFIRPVGNKGAFTDGKLRVVGASRRSRPALFDRLLSWAPKNMSFQEPIRKVTGAARRVRYVHITHTIDSCRCVASRGSVPPVRGKPLLQSHAESHVGDTNYGHHSFLVRPIRSNRHYAAPSEAVSTWPHLALTKADGRPTLASTYPHAGSREWGHIKSEIPETERGEAPTLRRELPAAWAYIVHPPIDAPPRPRPPPPSPLPLCKPAPVAAPAATDNPPHVQHALRQAYHPLSVPHASSSCPFRPPLRRPFPTPPLPPCDPQRRSQRFARPPAPRVTLQHTDSHDYHP